MLLPKFASIMLYYRNPSRLFRQVSSLPLIVNFLIGIQVNSPGGGVAHLGNAIILWIGSNLGSNMPKAHNKIQNHGCNGSEVIIQETKLKNSNMAAWQPTWKLVPSCCRSKVALAVTCPRHT